MESLMSHHLFEGRHLLQSKAPAVKWFKEWVPQDVVATGGKCRILKWVTEDMLQALNEQSKEAEAPEPEPEPTTEVLFLCSYEGCGKTFVDVGALKKHSHIHGERQYICHYEGCGKKFLDSSKLKRHFLIHTGERDFVCPHEGCGKAFSLDFNLRSHMKTHSQENYHICPYVDCGKRYAHEYKLKNHVSIHHEKGPMELTNYIPLPEKLAKTAKPMPPPMPVGGGSAVSMAPDRPYTCPLEGCDKAYIHMYKLNLHLRKGHKLTLPDDHAKPAAPPPFYPDNHEADEWSDQDVLAAYTMKQQQQRGKGSKQKQHKPSPKVLPSKMARRRGSSPPATSLKAWPVKEGVYREAGEDGDSEETEEDQDGGKDRWRFLENSGGDNGGGGGGDDDTVDGDGGGGDDDEEETEYED